MINKNEKEMKIIKANKTEDEKWKVEILERKIILLKLNKKEYKTKSENLNLILN